MGFLQCAKRPKAELIVLGTMSPGTRRAKGMVSNIQQQYDNVNRALTRLTLACTQGDGKDPFQEGAVLPTVSQLYLTQGVIQTVIRLLTAVSNEFRDEAKWPDLAKGAVHPESEFRRCSNVIKLCWRFVKQVCSRVLVAINLFLKVHPH